VREPFDAAGETVAVDRGPVDAAVWGALDEHPEMLARVLGSSNKAG
jgi:hypothetical protein